MGLSVTEVFGTAFATLRERIGPLLAIWAIFFVLQIALTFVLGGASMVAALSGGDPAAIGAGMGLSTVLFYLVYLLVSLAGSAAMTHQASPLHAPGLGDSLGAGARGAPSLLGAYVLLFLAYLVAAIPIGLVFGLLAMAGPAIAVILAVLILPLVIWLACRLSMLVPAVAVERIANPINALTRTWAMTKGQALSIFVVFLVFGIAALVVFGILAAPLIAAIMEMQNSGTPPDFGALGVGTIIGLLLAALAFGLFSPCLISAIHAKIAGHLDRDTPEVFS